MTGHDCPKSLLIQEWCIRWIWANLFEQLLPNLQASNAASNKTKDGPTTRGPNIHSLGLFFCIKFHITSRHDWTPTASLTQLGIKTYNWLSCVYWRYITPNQAQTKHLLYQLLRIQLNPMISHRWWAVESLSPPNIVWNHPQRKDDNYCNSAPSPPPTQSPQPV